MICATDLQFALENGIIDSARLQEQIDMKRNEEILKRHPYKVYQGKDGRWETYIFDEEKKRRLIKRKKRDDLMKFLIDLYDDKQLMTFEQNYVLWREYHDQMISDSSVTKYDSDRLRYFAGSRFEKLPINKVTSDDVEVFIKERVDSLQLCQAACKTLYHYIENTLDFAVRHGYIDKNPMIFMEAKQFYKYCYDSERSRKEKTISEEKAMLLQERFEEDHKKKPFYIPLYAVELAALTGMRVGEIAALTWDCVFDTYILVDKSQKFNAKSKEYYIDRTKNQKIRRFPVTDAIKRLLDVVKDVEDARGWHTEYIFSGENGPLTFRVISSCLKNKCRQVGIDAFGIHAYRRTVNSMMAKNGVPTSIRAELLGHSKEVNERYYTFDVSTMSDKSSIIAQVNAQMKQPR